MKEPNVYIILTKGNKSTQVSGTATKAQKWFSNSLSKRPRWHSFDKGLIKVIYGRDKGEAVTNEMKLETYDDLKWSIKGFLDKTLYL